MNRRVICILTTSAAALVPAAAFVPRTSCPAGASCLNMAPPGGWGIPGAGGTSFRDEEFADNRGRKEVGRRGYDAYEMENRGAFMKRVRADAANIKQKKKDDLKEIARMAGIKSKDKTPYGRFDTDDFDDNDDDLDLRVDFDDDDVQG